MESFSQWLCDQEKVQKEVSTDTAQVATFARPVIGGPTRMYPEPITFDDNEKKKKRKD